MSHLNHTVHRLGDLTPSTTSIACPRHRCPCPLLGCCSWAAQPSAPCRALCLHASAAQLCSNSSSLAGIFYCDNPCASRVLVLSVLLCTYRDEACYVKAILGANLSPSTTQHKGDVPTALLPAAQFLYPSPSSNIATGP